MLGLRPAALVLVVACIGCSADKPPTTPAPIIELGELTIRFDDNPIARLHADGTSESVGDGAPGPNAVLRPGPTLHADGTITFTKPGITARVASDGDIFIVTPGRPDQLYGHLLAGQLVHAGAHDSGVRLDGAQLIQFYDAKPTATLGVIAPLSMGRTALILTAAFLIETSTPPR